MRNFISEDDIEQAILSKLKAEPFEYDILICDADPSKRDDLNDGTGRNSKKECVLPDVMLSSLKRINPTIEEDKIKEIVKTLRQDYTGTDIVDTNYKLYRQIRNNIKSWVSSGIHRDLVNPILWLCLPVKLNAKLQVTSHSLLLLTVKTWIHRFIRISYVQRLSVLKKNASLRIASS